MYAPVRLPCMHRAADAAVSTLAIPACIHILSGWVAQLLPVLLALCTGICAQQGPGLGMLRDEATQWAAMSLSMSLLRQRRGSHKGNYMPRPFAHDHTLTPLCIAR